MRHLASWASLMHPASLTHLTHLAPGANLTSLARFTHLARLALGAARAPWAKPAAWVCAAGLAWTLALQPALAQGLQPVPPLSARVIDQTGTLAADQVGALEARLAAFERERGSQVVVLVIRSTQPEDIAAYAQRVASDWKIGRADVGDGLLLVVALDDRRIRIEVARALEGAVPDVLAGRVIREVMTPAFRQGDVAGGITAGVDRLLRLIEGEALPAPPASGAVDPEPGFKGLELALFGLFALPIVGAVARGIAGRKLGSVLTGAAGGWLAHSLTSSWVFGVGVGLAALLAVWVMGSRSLAQAMAAGRSSGRSGPGGWGGGGFGGGGGGFGGGRGGGGGFSSGGGGGFGGGGASGGW